MNDISAAAAPLTQREILVSALYEAAELEHNLMCTYLYAAFSLKDGTGEGLGAQEAAAVKRWPSGTSPPRSAAARASGARIFRSTLAISRRASR